MTDPKVVHFLNMGHAISTEDVESIFKSEDKAIMLAYDEDGCLRVRTTNMPRNEALWILMEAIDYVRQSGVYAPRETDG